MGLFVCSGSTSTPTTATFDHVAFTGGTGGLVTTPAAPASVFAAGSSKAVTVRWLPSFGATGYDLLRSTTSGGGYTVIASNLSTSKTSYVDTAVTAGTTYYYVVRAKNAAGTSGNSPEYGDSLVPLAMSNLAFSGTATASYTNSNPLEVPSEAFDSDPGSKWFDSAAPTGWLQEDFGANNAQIVKRYTINSADVATRDPKDWTLLGSQDGVNWTTLDSQSGQLFDYRMQQKTYDIANTTAYRYYRLNVTANNGATGLAIAELGLWSDTGRTLADGRYRLVSRRSNKVMGVDGGAATNGAQLSQSDWTGSDSQQWDLVWQGNGQYRATSVASGKAIDNGGTSNTGAVLNIQPWSGGSRQLWQVLPDSDGFYRFKSANSGLVADVSSGSTASGAKIIQWTSSGSDNQQWMFSIGSAPQPAAAAPSSLSATPGSISTINLAWTASPGAVSYNVKRATTSGGPFATIATGINTPSYQDTDLTPNTTYYYVVSPVNGTGEGADSAPASATTPAGAPAAPTGISAKPGTGQVILNWTMTGGATSYMLKCATASSGPYTTVASNLVGTTFTDTGLTNGVTYYYVLAAANAYGQSPDSSEVNVMPSDLAVRLKFDEGAQTTAYDATGNGWNGTLMNGPTWSSSGKMNGAVTLGGTDEFVSLPAGVVNGLTAITVSAWINLANVTTWQRVFDFGTGTNNSMFLTTQYSTANGSSNRLRFTIRTPSVAEQQINSSVATPIGTWAHVAITLAGGVGTMYLNGAQVGQNNAMTLTPASLGATTLDYIGKSESSSDPYLSGSIDDFRIYSRALTPAEAKTLATQTAPPAPTSLAATAGNGQVALTWAAAANAATYTVKRAAVSGGPYVALATGLAGTSFTDTSVTNDTPYYYVVSATNLVDTGADSAQAAATPSLPPTLSAFDVNDGAVQRSMVTSLKLAFSQPVTLGSGAISLLKNGAPADGVTVTASAGPSNQYVLTFSGSSVVGGSLADGSYSLVLSGAAVTNASNISMASDASFNFKRLFGDINGNGVVNGIDYGAFQAAYGSTAGSPAYVSAFDYDNNGAVSGIDYGQFRTRYGIAL